MNSSVISNIAIATMNASNPNVKESLAIPFAVFAPASANTVPTNASPSPHAKMTVSDLSPVRSPTLSDILGINSDSIPTRTMAKAAIQSTRPKNNTSFRAPILE